MKSIKMLLLVILVLRFLPVQAQNPNLGASGAQFLKIPVSGRAAAMGGAFIGICQDATSVFWNPAGIAQVKTHALHFSHSKWFDTFAVNAAAYVYQAGNFGAVGIGVLSLSTDDMEITTEASPNGTGRFYDAQDLALSLSYGRHLTDRFCVGLTARYVQQRIWNETAGGLAFDVGTQYQLPFHNLVIAMSMTNFGPDMRFNGADLSVKYDADSHLPNRLTPTRLETEAFPLPLNFEFGLAMELFRNRYIHALAAVDAVHPNDNRERLHMGAELAFFDRLFLRGGYKLNHDDELYNFGFGLTAFLSGRPLSVDYAWSAYDILPDVQRISFGMSF
jgi:hypothetical protein